MLQNQHHIREQQIHWERCAWHETGRALLLLTFGHHHAGEHLASALMNQGCLEASDIRSVTEAAFTPRPQIHLFEDMMS